VPYAQAHNEANLARVAAILPHEVGSAKEASVERDTDVGFELATNLVTKAKSNLDVIEARAGSEPFHSLEC